MAWGGKDNNNKGPWGKFSGGGSGGGNQGGNNSGGPKGPDLDELAKKFNDKFKSFFENKNQPGKSGAKPFLIILAGLIILWLVGGFYKVDPDEQAVILRFGQFSRTADPGLNYRLPSPIETAIIHKVTRVNRVEIGLRSANNRNKAVSQANLSQESLMLTGDENIIDINFEVQWKISDIKKFTFSLKDPEETVKSAAESAMREIIGKTPIAKALSDGRSGIEVEAQTLLQNILTYYDIGIDVITVKMLKSDPPAQVIDSFRDVQAARIDKEREQNQAESYRNDIIPRARGEAERIILEAEAYKKQVIAKAQGDAARFVSVYEEYKNAKDVTKRRIYLETMEQILRGMNKIVVDNNKQGVVPYLPLNEIRKTVQQPPQPQPAQGGQQ